MPESAGSEVSETPLLDHLEQFRRRIITALAALFVGFGVGFVLVHNFGVIRILVRPIEPFLQHQDGRLAAFSPLTPFMLEIKVAFLVGVILAFPVFVYQLWAHLSPMLDRDQKRIIAPSLHGGVVLFGLGVLAAYWILPFSLRLLFGFQESYLELVIEANQYLGFVVRLLIAFGLVFEIPVVVMILTALGLVTPTFLRQKRRHAIVIIFILASLITPGDVASTFLLAIPMTALYELSILLSTLVGGREKREEEAADAVEEVEEVVEET